MYTEAPDQVLRLSLEGAEFALKISGAAAKNIAAALYAVLKDQQRTKGKARITTMLRQQRSHDHLHHQEGGLPRASPSKPEGTASSMRLSL